MNTIKTSKRVIIKQFPFQLTEEEQRERGQRLAASVQNVYDARESAKLAASDNKKAIEGHEATVKQLREVVANGNEWRDVECEERFYLSTGEAVLVRLDTGETVNVRPMTQSERHEASQTQINFEKGQN